MFGNQNEIWPQDKNALIRNTVKLLIQTNNKLSCEVCVLEPWGEIQSFTSLTRHNGTSVHSSSVRFFFFALIFAVLILAQCSCC